MAVLRALLWAAKKICLVAYIVMALLALTVFNAFVLAYIGCRKVSGKIMGG